MRLVLFITMLVTKLLRALHTSIMSISKAPPITATGSRIRSCGDQLLGTAYSAGQFKRSMTALHTNIDTSLPSPSQGTNQSSIPSKYTDEDILSIPTMIPLTSEEVELFKLFTDTVRQKKLKTTVRVAGNYCFRDAAS